MCYVGMEGYGKDFVYVFCDVGIYFQIELKSIYVILWEKYGEKLYWIDVEKVCYKQIDVEIDVEIVVCLVVVEYICNCVLYWDYCEQLLLYYKVWFGYQVGSVNLCEVVWVLIVLLVEVNDVWLVEFVEYMGLNDFEYFLYLFLVLCYLEFESLFKMQLWGICILLVLLLGVV